MAFIICPCIIGLQSILKSIDSYRLDKIVSLNWAKSVWIPQRQEVGIRLYSRLTESIFPKFDIEYVKKVGVACLLFLFRRRGVYAQGFDRVKRLNWGVLLLKWYKGNLVNWWVKASQAKGGTIVTISMDQSQPMANWRQSYSGLSSKMLEESRGLRERPKIGWDMCSLRTETYDKDWKKATERR